jgi:hypothetical protein
MKYTVYLYQEASQGIKVEADDYEEAIEKAFDIGMDQPNISNKFEFGGEDQLDCVLDQDGNEVYVEPRR